MSSHARRQRATAPGASGRVSSAGDGVAPTAGAVGRVARPPRRRRRRGPSVEDGVASLSASREQLARCLGFRIGRTSARQRLAVDRLQAVGPRSNWLRSGRRPGWAATELQAGSVGNPCFVERDGGVEDDAAVVSEDDIVAVVWGAVVPAEIG